MESICIRYFHIDLMRQILNYFINSLNFFLALLIFKIIVLHLIKNYHDTVEYNLMDFAQKCLSSGQATCHFLLFHDAVVFSHFVFYGLKVLY